MSNVNEGAGINITRIGRDRGLTKDRWDALRSQVRNRE